ncbi:MAG TPA: hypothetical protein VGX76_01585 [Pirellulales bacterium]|jgi:hypothetical protein|nr:hypothetical protein [Pirellulales bacterium]
MARVRCQPFVVGVSLLLLSPGASPAAEKHNLSAGGKPGDAVRVEVLLEVGGDLKLVDEGKVNTLPMSVVGKLRYCEKLVDPASAGGDAPRSLRHYERAEAVIKIEKETLSPKLRDDRRTIAAAVGPSKTLYSPLGPLTRDELDLIEVPCDNLLIDQLLPGKPVSQGERWRHSDDLLAGLLGLDAVSQSDVASELISIDAQAAQIELTGKVIGAAEGVATQIELAGKYRYDLIARRVTRLAISIKENRSVGHVAAGLDVVAKLQMHVTPLGEVAELSGEALRDVRLDPGAELRDLEYQPANGMYRIAYDCRWHIVSDRGDVLALRMVDRGDLIAQCNLTTLPDVEPTKHPTLARFQQDIERTLGKDFGQFVRASQAVNEAGYAFYRVEVEGVVADLPIRWNYYLLADDQGHLAVFVFTVEGELIGQLGNADEAIVSTLRFTPRSDE